VFALSGKIFSALSNPVRLKILEILENLPMPSSKLATIMKTTVQANQKHVSKLTKCGMVTKELMENLKKLTLEQYGSYH
jgi:DNA-binding transcriptional ArsR family regulator